MSDYTASAAEVKALREATGAGIMECKNALREANGDQEAAVKLLRERGIAKTGKRADRTTTEGVIEAYVHGGRIGVLVEIGCETDFVAGTDEFKAFAHEVALQISATADARWVSREDVPAEIIEGELEIYRAQAADKPENVRDRIVAGQARQVALDGLPARAALRARRRSHDRRPAHRDRGEDGRERADQALHALRARRLRGRGLHTAPRSRSIRPR